MASSLLHKLENFDRRWIFLAMILAVVIPLLLPLGLPARASPPVKDIYYTVEALPEDSVVLLSVDLDPASTPELEPFFRSVVLHLKRKRAKIILVTTWYAAPPLVERWVSDTLERAVTPDDVVYRKHDDFVWMGFREGREAMISNLGQDLWATYAGQTNEGVSLSEIPLMERARRLSDFDLVVMISAGYPGAKEYLQLVQSRYKLPMVAACTAVSMTDLSPYYDSKQLLGLAGGMSASAEYEKLVGYPDGMGAKGLDVLNVGHLVVIGAIVFGNVIFFASRRRGRRRRT